LKTILVPLESLENGSSILQYAFDFAAFFSAKVIILKSFGISTVTGPTPSIDKALKETHLKELTKTLENISTKNTNFSIELVKGGLVENCVEYMQENDIDLVISKPKHSHKTPHLFIGHVTGAMINKLECPLLLVPENYVFNLFSSILMAIKSGNIKKDDALLPLKRILNIFPASLTLLQVKTPKLKAKDLHINNNLLQLKSTLFVSENETVYHGVLEYLHEVNPDLLCVIRRKKGFFSKLWDQNTVKKSDFESRVPLLILKGVI